MIKPRRLKSENGFDTAKKLPEAERYLQDPLHKLREVLLGIARGMVNVDKLPPLSAITGRG